MRAGTAAMAAFHLNRLRMNSPPCLMCLVRGRLFREPSPPPLLADREYANLVGIPPHRDLVAFADARRIRQHGDQPISRREQEIGPVMAALKREHSDLGVESIVVGRVIRADPQLLRPYSTADDRAWRIAPFLS